MVKKALGISVLIPTYNGKDRLKKNLPAVIEAINQFDPRHEKSEIVILDDASPVKNIESFLNEKFPQVKYSRSKKNLRFARNCNQGARLAKYGIIIFLNDDVQPEVNFITPLIKHFHDLKVFGVGCLEQNLAGSPPEIILGGRGILEFKRGLFIHHRAKNQKLIQTDWITGGSGAFNKKLFLELGGFNPIFSPAYWEDLDLSYRAKKLGYKIIFEPQAKVKHFHEQTNLQIFGSPKIQIISFRNQLIFTWKNLDSPKKLAEHLIWFPYHFIFTSIKSKGKFFLGFLQALIKFPQIIQ